MDFITRVFDTSGFPARWQCGSAWTDEPWVGWLHIFSDLGVWSAYVAIPLVLVYFIVRRKDLPRRKIFLLFGAFILACGTTHLMEAVIFWWPAYRLAGVIKLLTAIVSWATVIALVPALPRVLAMRSPEEFEREIEARKKAEQALQETNDDLERRIQSRTADLATSNRILQQEREWFRTTLASIGDAVIATDTEGRVTFLNPVAQTLTAWQEVEARGQNLEVVFQIVTEKTRTSVESPAMRALKEGLVVGLANHTVLIARDGTERPIDDSAAPIRNASGQAVGAVLVFRDVTLRRRADDALRQSEQKFRLLADTIPQLAWIARPDGHIFWYNQRWHEYTGTTLDQMEGWGWQSVHAPEELPKVLERWNASIASGEPFEMVFPLRRADGEFRPFLTRVMPLCGNDGSILQWFGTNTDITEAKRVEEELREARSRLESTLAAGDVGTWEFDPISNRVRADRNLAQIFGVTPEEAAGGPMELFTNVVHPADRSQFAANMTRALEAGETLEIEYRLAEPGGGVRWVVARGRVERDESGRAVRMPGLVVDITQRKLAEERERMLLEEASTANAKFRAFFEQGPLFAGIMALDGTILEPNRLSLEACGYTRDQVVGRPFWECPWWSRSADLMQQIKEASAQAAAGKTYRAEMPYFVADGRQRMVDLILLPIIDEAGRVLFLAPTGTDITHRHQLEDDLRKLAADLSDADRRKNEFLAVLAHELRNPLAPITNALELMRLTGGSDNEVGPLRDMMERQVEQMVHLVNYLLDVSRITSGKIVLRNEHLDLSEVVKSALEASRPPIDAARHELTVTLPPSPLHVEGDKTRLAQVLSNLLANAAKYTPEAGRIWLTISRDDQQAVIRVRDTGIGIPTEMLPLIFEMFTQVDRNLGRSQGGLGIGLALVRTLVEMHGGTVEAYSDGPAKGSEFVVRLPLTSSEPKEQGGDGKRNAGRQDENAAARLRILVVDDNQDAVETLQRLLSAMGNEVRIAYDGPSALETATSFRPDVVLLDIGLPGMSGHDVARRMRQMPETKAAVLVAQTGWGQEGDKRQSEEAGFNAHLVKPVDATALRLLLAELTAKGC